MIAPFLDYEEREMVVSNSNQVTYTLPRRALVVCGRYRRDDTGGIAVYCSYVDTIQDSDTSRVVLFSADSDVGSGDPYDSPATGPQVLEAGRIIRVDAPDDARINLHIFYLPTAP